MCNETCENYLKYKAENKAFCLVCSKPIETEKKASEKDSEDQNTLFKHASEDL